MPFLAAAAATAGGGGFLSGLSSFAGPISGLLGGVLGNNKLSETTQTLEDLAQSRPTSTSGPFGGVNATSGDVREGGRSKLQHRSPGLSHHTPSARGLHVSPGDAWRTAGYSG